MTDSFATYCSPCDARVIALPTEDPRISRLFEYERDGFTPSPDQHICWPREVRIGRLVEQRRKRGQP